ncbi:poly(A)-specific ribonuclease [Malassezia equina]|uniref:CCR4-Not complex 3'-5'-exoribonuclease subunit Ccr4 n=1 Tax=Malassezia equina TaxID=1381935 RepID=A0AAF0EB33_9BASI|nr:poly(A)-specific ribonuclease [Malassezia equina]
MANPMSSRYPGSGMSWMSRQQAHSPFAAPQGTPPMSTLPPAVNLSVGTGMPTSPNYPGLGSPHAVSMVKPGISPVPAASSTASPSTTSALTDKQSEWDKQLVYADISRQSFSPHHHARAAALAARSSITHGQDPSKGIQLPAGVAAIGLSLPLPGQDDRKGTWDVSATMSPSKPLGTRTQQAESTEEKTWSQMDMGGLKLKNISDDVFRYTFLTSLFINHNNLTSISPAVVQLKNLTVLDASGNQLIMIPPELGMLTELRELFLFDNQLTVLPPELGTLYRLRFLGIEGNPLQENLKDIIKQDGVQALIAYLRDSCPMSVPPPDREWISLDPDVPSYESEEDNTNNMFAVLSYNILCKKYATAQMYGYTPSWALDWDYRKEFILQEIISYGADICCLQEVETGEFDQYFEPKLKQNAYEGIFWPKSRAKTMREDERVRVDGCATFINSQVYQIVDKRLIEFNQIALQRPDFKKTEDIFNRVMTKDNIASIAMLEHRKTGAKLIVANAHMHWDPEFRDVKLVQAAVLMEQLEVAGDTFAKMPPQVTLESGVSAPTYASGKDIPTVVCGDFNSTPDSGVYEFLSQGLAPGNHEDFMNHTYGTYTSEGLRHGYALRSAYQQIGELPFTNHTPGFSGTIDYIWYTTNSLAASGLLGEVDTGYLSRVVGFPNAHFPSDHVCILAEFKMPPRRPASSR